MIKYMPFVFALLVGCSGGNESSAIIEQPPVVNHPAQGTVLDEYCEDPHTLVIVTADGAGGEIVEKTENSEECGYEPPPAFGTPLSEPYCVEEPSPENRFIQLLTLVQDVADGNGGKQVETIQEDAEECGFIPQMDPPASCPSDPTDTKHPWYDYMNCDGVLQRTGVDFPYEVDNEQLAVIDLLAVVDSKLTDEDMEGLTHEEYIRRELDFANKVFADSGVYIVLRLVDLKMVEVGAGDLRRQYTAFFGDRYEFSDVEKWQRNAEADIAFLFKKKEEDPIACGVAQVDGTRGVRKTRGITQCFQNTVFQEYAATRYYERAHETFVHEVGHILGLDHHFGDHQGTVNIFEYSFGYLLPEYQAPVEKEDNSIWAGYGTVMSYSDLPTGRFSDYDAYFEIPENSKTVRLGTKGGCFCLQPIETQPPETQAVKHLNRVRYRMSQLAEDDYIVAFSPAPSPDPLVYYFENPVCYY